MCPLGWTAYVEFGVALGPGLESLFAGLLLGFAGGCDPAAGGGRGEARGGAEGGAGDDRGHGGCNWGRRWW